MFRKGKDILGNPSRPVPGQKMGNVKVKFGKESRAITQGRGGYSEFEFHSEAVLKQLCAF